MSSRRPRRWPLRISAVVALVFGLLTIISGGTVLFSGAEIQTAAGNAVMFVLWFNFLSGFAYILAGIGIATQKEWALKLSIGLAVAIAVVFALFGLHVLLGGAFEMRTVAAMTLRLLVWIAISTTLMIAKRVA